MAITDTLVEIKKFFLNWHREKYADIHTKETNEVNNNVATSNYLTTNSAVYNALNQQSQNFQTTLNNYDVQINETIDTKINNATKNIKVASYGTLPDVISEYNTYRDPDYRGFNWPSLDSQASNGLITPKEKADIHYMGEWVEISGRSIGAHTGITKYMTMWINLGLRLVYFKFYYMDCPLLKDEYIKKQSTRWSIEPHGSENEVFNQVRPISTIYAPTYVKNIYIGVRSNGLFEIYSTQPVTENVNIAGSLMWYYRDGPPSEKIGKL